MARYKTISQPPTNVDVNSSEFFRWLALDVVERLAVESAVSPTYSGSWADYSSSAWKSAQFYKDPFNRVYINGLVQNLASPTTEENTTIFTLPSGYRPAKHLMFIVQAVSAGTPEQCRVEVRSDGRVIQQGGTASQVVTWLSLSGISFRAEQ